MTRLRSLHETSANAILWLVGLHVAAVLLHQYGFRDGLLRPHAAGPFPQKPGAALTP